MTAKTATNDDELIQLLDRIARRDETALRALYDRTSGKLHGLAIRITGTRGDAAGDVLQDSFVQIWQRACDYRASLSPPMAWLGLIVKSRALDALRRQRAQRQDQTQDFDDGLAETLPGDSANPMETHLASEQAWVLHQCLGRLENRQKEVISLAYFRELSHGELAEQLKLPLGTVKSWIRRGLEQLRSCLAQVA